MHLLEPFDLVMLVVLGDLQQGIMQNDFSVTWSAIVIVTVTLLSMLTVAWLDRSRAGSAC